MTREWSDAQLGLRVVLEDSAEEMMRREARLSNRLETGGILLGNYVEGRTAIVAEATNAPRDSRRTPWSFRRGIKGLDALLEQRFAEGRHYLGEWHYHPYASPTPSGTDASSMHAISKREDSRCDTPILIIAGGSPTRLVYRAHIARDGRLYRLALIGDTGDDEKARWWHRA